MLIKRILTDEIRKHLESDEITIITGPRQVGKTTLMLQLKEELDQRQQKTLFLNLDYESHMIHLTSQDSLLKKIRLEFGNEKGYLFIDEIQRKTDAGIFLKGIYDLRLSIKFIVSGSGSLELKEKIHESLAGRKKLFELLPVNFFEFIDFKTEYKYSSRLNDFLETEWHRSRVFLEEYLNFGGYPRLVIQPLISERLKEMDELYQSYITRDIIAFLKVERPEAFSRMIRLLAVTNGYPVNYSRLAQQCGISFQTLRLYLWYAEKTFIIKVVQPFFRNKAKEITKAPAIYFTDHGMRNYPLGLMGNIHYPEDFSFLFQNMICLILEDSMRWTGWILHFYRTTDGTEVDFVLEKGMEILPVEVKYTEMKSLQMSRAFRSFIEKYQPALALIVNLNLEQDIIYNHTKVKILPFYKLNSTVLM